MALVRAEGLQGLLFFWAHDDWFWFSDATDGRLKGVLAGICIAGILIFPLRMAQPPSSTAAPAAANSPP